MKKLVISAVMLAVVSIVSVQASATSSPIEINSTHHMIQEKVEVKPEDLPEAVRKTLAGEEYKEWTISKAYSVTDDKGEHHFEIALTKGEQTATLKIDKDGKVLE